MTLRRSGDPRRDDFTYLEVYETDGSVEVVPFPTGRYAAKLVALREQEAAERERRIGRVAEAIKADGRRAITKYAELTASGSGGSP